MPRFGSDSTLRLTDFEIGGFLGDGAFGQVVAARKCLSKYPVALKVISTDKMVISELLKEITIHRILPPHPNIVGLFGHFQSETSLCLILEYCPGVTLRHHSWKKRGLPEREVAKYVSDVSRALQHCHHHHVMHRDIKTENVQLLEPNGTVKLLDFGVAVKIGERQRTICGTEEYMAPEILKDHGYGKEIDLWALGVLVFELLAGSTPFTPPVTGDQKIKWPVGIDHLAQELITGLLQVIPQRRLSFDSVLEHPFLSIVDGSP